MPKITEVFKTAPRNHKLLHLTQRLFINKKNDTMTLFQALGLHSHDGDGHDHSHDEVYVEDYTWKMLVMMSAVWLFFMLQLGMEALTSRNEAKQDSDIKLTHTKSVGGNNVSKDK